ncbi:MAG: outer membrane beta-barrel protein [Rhodomicrobium sp.]
MIRLICLTSLSVFALAASANAADMYHAPEGVSLKDAAVDEPVWTGFYAGLNTGYGWSANVENILLYNEGKSFHVPGRTSSGVFGGGQIGYNWQPLTAGGYKDGPALSNFVFGVEADIQGSGIGDKYNTIIPEFDYPANVKADLDYFGTVRGRIGYIVDRTLFYFTGGLAYGGIDTSVYDYTGAIKNDGILTGYALGGGAEHKLTPKLSLKAEYQYIDLGEYRLTQGSGSATQTTTGNLDANFHTVRIGLN